MPQNTERLQEEWNQTSAILEGIGAGPLPGATPKPRAELYTCIDRTHYDGYHTDVRLAYHTAGGVLLSKMALDHLLSLAVLDAP